MFFVHISLNAVAALWSAPLLNGNAYLDPGSGSFIIQILIASLLGAGFLIKTYWKKIVAFFRKESPKEPSDQDL